MNYQQYVTVPDGYRCLTDGEQILQTDLYQDFLGLDGSLRQVTVQSMGWNWEIMLFGHGIFAHPFDMTRSSWNIVRKINIMKNPAYSPIRIDLGTNQQLATDVVAVLAALGYRTSVVLDAIHRYQERKIQMTIVAFNDPTTGKPSSVRYSDTKFYDSEDFRDKGSHETSCLPRLGYQGELKRIKISSDYTAEVAADKTSVQVGCQIISKEKVSEIWQALQ